MPENITNATQSQKPNFYYCRHMQPGTCRYDKEMILVDVDAVQAMIKSGHGIPVYINHQVGVPVDEVKEKAAGYVVDSFYNELDGWAWFKIMAIDDEIRVAVSKGWSVSNAYSPGNWKEGGTKNNVKFDREITDGEFTHLAIVPNPRYENACIMTPDEFKNYQDARKAKLAEVHNSNPESSKGPSMFKFLSRKNAEVTNASEATHVELDDGRIVTLAQAKELLNAKGKKNAKKNEGEDDAGDAVDEDLENMCDVDGDEVSLKDMKNAYRNMKKNEKRNADEAEEKAKKEKGDKENAEKKNAEDKAAEEKKNADEAAAKKKDEDEKTNSKGFYDQLLNAHQIPGDSDVQIIEISTNMTQRGKDRYGSGN